MEGYEGRWTKELFQITKAFLRQNIPIYEVTDLADTPIDGFYYERELNLLNKNIREETFEIERIMLIIRVLTHGNAKIKKY